jgi:hypothetical protein
MADQFSERVFLNNDRPESSKSQLRIWNNNSFFFTQNESLNAITDESIFSKMFKSDDFSPFFCKFN